MEWSLFSKIAEELVLEAHSPTLMFALHSEPLLDKRIFDWVKYIKSINPKCYCIIATNGELLDRFTVTEMVQSGLDQMNVNLSAYSKETYEIINTGLDYDRVMSNVHRLLSDKFMKQKLETRFVLTQENAHEAQRAVNYWQAQGIHIKVVEITNRAGALDNYEGLRLKGSRYTRPFLLRTWKRLMSTAKSMTGCELPFYQMNILFNGDVIICSCDWKRAVIVGNVKTSSVRAIWNSERMNEIRRLILRKRYEQINSCRECSLAR